MCVSMEFRNATHLWDIKKYFVYVLLLLDKKV